MTGNWCSTCRCQRKIFSLSQGVLQMGWNLLHFSEVVFCLIAWSANFLIPSSDKLQISCWIVSWPRWSLLGTHFLLQMMLKTTAVAGSLCLCQCKQKQMPLAGYLLLKFLTKMFVLLFGAAKLQASVGSNSFLKNVGVDLLSYLLDREDLHGGWQGWDGEEENILAPCSL